MQKAGTKSYCSNANKQLTMIGRMKVRHEWMMIKVLKRIEKVDEHYLCLASVALYTGFL